ncbi:ATP-binding protein [Amycolatopsis pigmentata]|uniref:ATP-binding protein n=1 Tax=Amycolatopsis pigmentata TaxID=450801 RepID=A0ABW5FMQ6_9PSEU
MRRSVPGRKPGVPAGVKGDHDDLRGSLPAESAGLVGRRSELADVRQALTRSRLVTLTGLGGVGKTRLAQGVAVSVRRAFPDGVWFVDLAFASDANPPVGDEVDLEPLATIVATELGVRTGAAESAVGHLIDYLLSRQLLLVLDNCEYAIPECSLLVDQLLRACPWLRVLATSREPLSIGGETTCLVAPLSVPDPGQCPDLAEMKSCDSVTLFCERAEAAQPGFRLTEDNRLAVAGVCARVDGLPLAIELAAAWVGTLTPDRILGNLDDRFALLAHGTRPVPARQHTLRACVDWSHDLCTEGERLLWRRLSVFAGGCELDAIEGICAGEELAGPGLLDAVGGLVSRSILVRDDQHGVARYRMLETIRDYGEQRLRAAGEYEVLRRRHRDWFERLAVRARTAWVSEREGHTLNQLRRVHPNIRAAIEYSLTEPGEAGHALRMLVALPWLTWWGLGLFNDGRRWLRSALARAGAPTAVRAQALALGASMALMQADATTQLEQAEEIARQLNDRATLACVDYVRGVRALYANDLSAAEDYFSRAQASLSEKREPDLQLRVLLMRSLTAALSGDPRLASACRAEIEAITGHGHAYYQILGVSAMAKWAMGNVAAAVDHAKTYLRFSRDQHIGDRFAIAWVVEILAWASAAERGYRRAGILLGAAETLVTEAATSFEHHRALAGFHRECVSRVRESLGEAAFTDALREGNDLSYEDILGYALGKDRHQRTSPPGATTTGLTRREREVADLIARGASNKEIASTLVIAQRTAQGHVENIMTKLGFGSRAQIAAWVTAQQPADDTPVR